MPSPTLNRFWEEHPALLYALAILLGCAWAFEGHWSSIFPAVILWFPCFFEQRSPLRMRLMTAFLAFLMMACYCTLAYRFPILPSEGIVGSAVFDITSISTSRTHFGTHWIYKGTLRTFQPRDPNFTDASARYTPVRVTLLENKEMQRPSADRSYSIQGRLKEAQRGSYYFIPDKEAAWLPIQGSWNFAEKRYAAKRAVSSYILKQMSHKRSGVFLAGIATGDFDDPLMAHEFGRFGLQHIMAISGFHFAIIASILSLLLRFIVSKKRANIVLIFLLSTYFIFLGAGPSILRAWISITIALGGFLLARRGNGLNSLGIALIAVLITDPLMWFSIGFQFSFGTTAAILLLFSLCDVGMQKLFAKRTLSHTINMDIVNQHGYCALATIRQAFSLTLAVNLFALPLMLFYFHKFPWMSLAYNLFFPFLVSLSMLFLILGILCHGLFPPLGTAVHAFNDGFTNYMLNYTYQMPVSVDYVWRVETVPVGLLVLYLCIVFCSGIYLRDLLKQRLESEFEYL